MTLQNQPILTEIPSTTARKRRINWLLLLSSLPVFGAVGAFAVIDNGPVAPLDVKTVVDDLALPTVADNSVDTFWREERIQSGDSLGSLLTRMGVTDPAALTYLRNQSELKGLQQLRTGRTVEAQTNSDGELLGLQYLDADGKLIQVKATADGYTVSKQDAQLSVGIAMRAGTIKSSLFAATDDANLPESISSDLADMFDSEINFRKSLRRGDRFKVIFETYSWNGQPVKTGRLLAAEFINAGKTYRAIAFTDSSGHTNYYSPDGHSLRQAFMRSPLPFTRVTSGFAMRLHPILGLWKQHKGVDFGAPIGTPVRVTADGVVSFVGTKTGYGNVVEVKHFGDYSTLYGHLSAFGPIKVGTKVSQGDLIAYTGMSGWATGPHLHYEFRIKNEPRDPMSEVVPVAMPMDAKLLPAFKAQAAQYLAKFDLMQNARDVALD